MNSRLRASALLAIVLPLGLAACSGGTQLVRDAAMASGVTGGEPKPAPDFVSQSRGQGLDYIPASTPDAPRASRRKTASEVGGAEAEMEALKKRNEARGNAARRAAGSAN